MKTPYVLLVEDNPDDVELTRLAFEECNLGNPMVVANNGAEALRLLIGDSEKVSHDKIVYPAVILLDLKLPKVSGLDVLKRIRAEPKTRCLPVVILTSSNDETDLINSYNLGANAYVRKPVNYIDFVKACKTLGLFWLILNEPLPVP